MAKDRITKANEVFITEYLKCFNGTEAYSRAYPKANRDSARANAAELLAKPSIKAEVERRLAEIHMTADEALRLMSDIARGDITDFLSPLGGLDTEKILKSGKGRLIKKIKQRTITKIGKGDKDDDVEIHDTELELYPADAALRDILKISKKLPADINIQVNITDD